MTWWMAVAGGYYVTQLSGWEWINSGWHIWLLYASLFLGIILTPLSWDAAINAWVRKRLDRCRFPAITVLGLTSALLFIRIASLIATTTTLDGGRLAANLLTLWITAFVAVWLYMGRQR